jgi:hypothetical protein
MDVIQKYCAVLYDGTNMLEVLQMYNWQGVLYGDLFIATEADGVLNLVPNTEHDWLSPLSVPEGYYLCNLGQGMVLTANTFNNTYHVL